MGIPLKSFNFVEGLHRLHRFRPADDGRQVAARPRQFIAAGVGSALLVAVAAAGVIATSMTRDRATSTSNPAEHIGPGPRVLSGPLTVSDFQIDAMRLERERASKLRYVFGTARNLAERHRFGVKIELQLLDHSGTPIALVTDRIGVVEPGREWKFKALATVPSVASARVLGISEEE